MFTAATYVQLLGCVRLFATPWTAAHQDPQSFTISQGLLKCMSTELVMLSYYLILRGPLLLPSVFPSIRVYTSESALLIRWPNCWSFSFSISPSNEYSGLISFRIDWFDLLAAQMTLTSREASKHHNLKESTLWHLASSMTQISRPDTTTGKNIALTIWTFVSKVMSLLFNTLSSFVTEEQVCFNLMTAITISSDLGVQKRKSVTVSTFSPFISHEVLMILVFGMLNVEL